MFGDRRIVVLDIGEEVLKASLLRHTSNNWLVEKSVSRTVPRKMEGEEAKAISSLLAEIDWRKHKTRPLQVVASINGQDVTAKILKLPPLREREFKKLDGLVQYEAERQSPIPLEEVVFDYQVIQRKAEGIEVLWVAIRCNKLNERLALLKDVGLHPAALTPSCLATFNALLAGGLLTDEPGKVCALRFAESFVDIVAVEDGVLRLARSSTLKKEGTSGNFLRELVNTLRISGAKSEKLIIMTEEEILPSGLTVETLKEALSISNCEHRPLNVKLALGLAWGYLNMPQTVSINLLKPLIRERKVRRAQERKRRLLRVVPIMAAILLAVVALFLWQKVDVARKELTQIRREKQLVEQRNEELTDLKRRREQLRGQVSAIGWVDADYPPLSYQLYQIALSTPDEIWLKGVSAPKKQRGKKGRTKPALSYLIVTGYARSQSEIDDFKKRLLQRDCFSAVKQQNMEEVLLRGENVLEFQLQLTSAKNEK